MLPYFLDKRRTEKRYNKHLQMMPLNVATQALNVKNLVAISLLFPLTILIFVFVYSEMIEETSVELCV